MNRNAFDHAVRAAGAVLGENEILVIGSQAVHGTIAGNLPPEAERSIEVDVAPLDDPDERKSDLIDGSIGEASMFHETFGYYAQGVSQSTAVLPDGWRDRLVRYESEATNGVVAWCLEIHDLWLSKAVAMRQKDVEFCRALAQRHLVAPASPGPHRVRRPVSDARSGCCEDEPPTAQSGGAFQPAGLKQGPRALKS